MVGVVMAPRSFDEDLGFFEHVENLSVEEFISNLGVEAFVKAVRLVHARQCPCRSSWAAGANAISRRP
jgi:hypothetical protein